MYLKDTRPRCTCSISHEFMLILTKKYYFKTEICSHRKTYLYLDMLVGLCIIYWSSLGKDHLIYLLCKRWDNSEKHIFLPHNNEDPVSMLSNQAPRKYLNHSRSGILQRAQKTKSHFPNCLQLDSTISSHRPRTTFL